MFGFIFSLLIGALAGYIAGRIIGSIVFGQIGLSATGIVGEILVSVVGACICIWIGRKLFN